MLNINNLTARLHLQIWTVDVEDWRIGADWRFITRKTLSFRNTPILTSMTGDLAPETQKWFFFQAKESSRNVLYFYYYCCGVNLFLASGTQKWFLYQAEKSSRNFVLLLYWHKGLKHWFFYQAEKYGRHITLLTSMEWCDLEAQETRRFLRKTKLVQRIKNYCVSELKYLLLGNIKLIIIIV